MNNDTIAAIATPSGQGGVGIIRISGDRAPELAKKISGLCPAPRYAHYGKFSDINQTTIDSGLTLYFKKPFSFTGEDVVEFHAHGGPVVLDLLLKEILQYDVRPARAGEFTERAFLNDKIDLAQAEAIADLIAADSEQAARAAMRSMQGEFSAIIHQLVEELIQLRIYVESALDFPEEEIDFLADRVQQQKMQKLHNSLKNLLAQAQQGEVLNKGLMIAIIGQPNVGKSSILNLFTRNETAIISEIAGTTRDIIKENINIHGVPLTIIDTAGIHITSDKVEQEGIKRAKKTLQQADIILQVIDLSRGIQLQQKNLKNLPFNKKKITIFNKADIGDPPEILKAHEVQLCATTAKGFNQVENKIMQLISHDHAAETSFSARSRHISQLQKTLKSVAIAEHNFINNQAGELVAEDLRQAQESLSQITGDFSSDDLLGEIFSSFCIGK